MGGCQNKREDLRSLLNLINGGVKINREVGISKYPLISVTNEKRDKCFKLVLNLKVSKQTRSEASEANKLSKSK